MMNSQFQGLKRLLVATFFVVMLIAPVADGKDRALLVGIDSYKNSVFNLHGSVKDVEIMQALLQTYWKLDPTAIKILTNDQATRNEILKQLDEWLVADTQPGDRVFFFFSGHGYQQRDQNGDETDDGLDETLVAYDAQQISSDSFPLDIRNMISDDEIAQRLDQLKNRQIWIFVDACHSGTVTRSLGQKNPTFIRSLSYRLTGIVKPKAKLTRGWKMKRKTIIDHALEGIVFTAVSAHQDALVDVDFAPDYQGLFTGRLQTALSKREADRNRDHQITLTELHDYLINESNAYCTAHSCDATPTLDAPAHWLDQDLFALARKDAVSQPQKPLQEQAQTLLTHDNQAGLQLRFHNNNRARLGETTHFQVTSRTGGYLLLLDIDANHQLTQLFPNTVCDPSYYSDYIPPGETVIIPHPKDTICVATAEEPVGKGLVVAILTDHPISLADLGDATQTISVIRDPQDYLATLAKRLRQAYTTEQSVVTRQWSITEVEYEIVRR